MRRGIGSGTRPLGEWWSLGCSDNPLQDDQQSEYKSWYINNNQLGFSLNVKNLLNNRNVKTGGYEQTRIVDNTVGKERFYRFDPKYFYMAGVNYMLNIYFRF